VVEVVVAGSVVDVVVVELSSVVVEVVVDDASGIELDEVELVLEVDDVGDAVVVGEGGGFACRRSSGGGVKSPVSIPSTAAAMKRCQIWAGKEPPVTARP